MALRPATEEDWVAFTGLPVPGTWMGLVYATPWLIEGMGAVYLGTDGRWWLTFERAPGVRRVKTAHRAAKQLLSEIEALGVGPVHAQANPRIDGATLWMERLGFRRSDDELGGLPVWVRS